MKTLLKSILEAVAVILLIPQLFVFMYFLFPTIRGADGWGMMKTLLVFGLTISRLAGPMLYVLYLTICFINRKQRRILLSFAICAMAGYAILVTWNIFIYKSFSYGWGALPILLCSSGVALHLLFQEKDLLAKPKPELFLASGA